MHFFLKWRARTFSKWTWHVTFEFLKKKVIVVWLPAREALREKIISTLKHGGARFTAFPLPSHIFYQKTTPKLEREPDDLESSTLLRNKDQDSASHICILHGVICQSPLQVSVYYYSKQKSRTLNMGVWRITVSLWVCYLGMCVFFPTSCTVIF